MANIVIIVDLETTGLDSNTEQIIEIGAIKVDLDTGVVLDQFKTFTKPEDNQIPDEFDEDGVLVYSDDDEIYDGELLPFKLTPFISKLTGISDEMLIGAPSNSEAVESFFKFAGDLPIWAFNAGFDSKFLNCHTESHRRLRDVLRVVKIAFPDLKSYKLAKAARQLDIKVEGQHHRAITDCLLTKEILLKSLSLLADKPHPHHHQFNASDYQPSEKGFFYGKTIVFTGALKTMTRDGAAAHASHFGFKIGSSVTKKTDYLVVGIQKLSVLAGHEKSGKQRKAEELITEGLKKIKIITENDFIKLCGIDV